ncbi:MATE family efflux transporter [Brachybacterium paraconglomeratum]|uniref:hypothetical protein n=1 Tax=Brachybacterium paraconglomeratum TaxID=173362 RepID=UPI003823217F
MKNLADRLLLIWGLLAASLIPTLVQFYAMFALDPGRFGVLVLVYIPLSVGNSAVYSLVCEPWAVAGAPAKTKADYDMVLFLLSAVTGTTSLVVGIALGEPLVGVLMGVAVACSVQRLGSRYASVLRERRRYISPPDSVGLGALAAGLVVVTALGPTLMAIATAWCISALVAASLSEPMSLPASFGSARRWVSTHWSSSRVLLADAALTEAGTVGIPLLLAPVMGVAQFGVFRAAASVTAPVRIMLNPLRPYLAKQPLAQVASIRVTLLALAFSTVAGTGACLALLLVRRSTLLEGSVIVALSNHAIVVGLFVLLYSASVFSYYVLRVHVGGGRLIRYRILQLVVQFAGPIAGYFLGGVSGAIGGRAGAFGVGLLQSTTDLWRSTRRRLDLRED